jgi:hypothetical protein
MDAAVDVKMIAILNVGIQSMRIILIMDQEILMKRLEDVNYLPAWMIVMYVQVDAAIVVRMVVRETVEVAVVVAVIVAPELVLVVQVLVLVAAMEDVKLNVH